MAARLYSTILSNFNFSCDMIIVLLITMVGVKSLNSKLSLVKCLVFLFIEISFHRWCRVIEFFVVGIFATRDLLDEV